jgi:long-subunit acyl-CoA synthetase (AMP-forming)
LVLAASSFAVQNSSRAAAASELFIVSQLSCITCCVALRCAAARQGCNRTSLQCVPLYDTLGEKAIEYVMSHSETKFVVAAGSKLAGLAKSLKGFKGKLLGVAYWGPAPEEAKQVSCTGEECALGRECNSS